MTLPQSEALVFRPVLTPRHTHVQEKPPFLRRLGRLAACGLLFSQVGCSILSWDSTVELVKAGSVAANGMMSVFPSSASDVVQHPHAHITNVCIEYNRASPAADVVPALQVELQNLGIESRVYERAGLLDDCHYWLKYTAYIQWDFPTFGDSPEPYLASATLTLRADGRVLSSAAYEYSGSGKWATTRKKMAALVKAVTEDPKTAAEWAKAAAAEQANAASAAASGQPKGSTSSKPRPVMH